MLKEFKQQINTLRLSSERERQREEGRGEKIKAVSRGVRRESTSLTFATDEPIFSLLLTVAATLI